MKGTNVKCWVSIKHVAGFYILGKQGIKQGVDNKSNLGFTMDKQFIILNYPFKAVTTSLLTSTTLLQLWNDVVCLLGKLW